MYCTKCGNKLNENDKFCTKCGKPVNGNVVDETVIENKPVQPDTDALPSVALPVNVAQNTIDGNVIKKNQVVAALLAFFLGCFGAHNFYLGRITRAIIQLIITIICIGFAIANAVLLFTNNDYWATCHGHMAFNIVNGCMLWPICVWILIEFVLILTSKEIKLRNGRRVIWDK